jgi:hypothetical protein
MIGGECFLLAPGGLEHPRHVAWMCFLWHSWALSSKGPAIYLPSCPGIGWAPESRGRERISIWIPGCMLPCSPLLAAPFLEVNGSRCLTGAHLALLPAGLFSLSLSLSLSASGHTVCNKTPPSPQSSCNNCLFKNLSHIFRN